ncbi:MAG TPA: metalloregulator ArsR/SmtB family transcription factor [Pseudonocardiaceae bacterium]|nr:metalloregulator ArsR/SmtB family transcription factor [Pseudonocardiaceae bacterium]
MHTDLDQPTREDITLVGVLHALSDPTRLAVVRQLEARGETLCGRLDVAVAKSTLSQHLRVLREAGVTRTRPEGTQRWLSVRRDDLDAKFPGLLDVVLTAVGSPEPRQVTLVAPIVAEPVQVG